METKKGGRNLGKNETNQTAFMKTFCVNSFGKKISPASRSTVLRDIVTVI